jgi:hypothetical protein
MCFTKNQRVTASQKDAVPCLRRRLQRPELSVAPLFINLPSMLHDLRRSKVVQIAW